MYSEVNGTMLLVLRDVTPYNVMLMLGAEKPQSSKFHDPINGDHYAFFHHEELAKIYAGSNGTTVMHRLSFLPWKELPNGIDPELVTDVFLTGVTFSSEPPQHAYVYQGGEVYAVRMSSLVVELTSGDRRTLETSSQWNIYCNTGSIAAVIELYNLIESGILTNDSEELRAFNNRLAISVVSEGSQIRHTVIA